MKSRRWGCLAVGLMIGWALAGCGSPQAPVDETMEAAAQRPDETLEDAATEETAELEAGFAETPAATRTISPAITRQPTQTPTPAPAATEENCVYDSEFIRDMTYPDGTPVRAGTQIDKSWRLLNSGTCPWRQAEVSIVPLDFEHPYLLVGMGPGVLSGAVMPGEEAAITVTINIAGDAPLGSTQRLDFQLQRSTGEYFGAQPTLVVVISAADPPPSAIGGGSGSISGTVWSDDDADGLRDSGERGIRGVTVSLLVGACPGGSGSGAEDRRLGRERADQQFTPVTDANGAYTQAGLQPGTYCAGIEPERGGTFNALFAEGAGYWTYPEVIAWDPLNSMWIDQEVGIGEGEAASQVDFGWHFGE